MNGFVERLYSILGLKNAAGTVINPATKEGLDAIELNQTDKSQYTRLTDGITDVDVHSVQGDARTNSTATLATANMPYGFNGTTWDRFRISPAADDSTDLEDLNGVVTNSILNARISNTAIRPLRADSSTNTLQTIDYAHHEIHSGSNFRVQHNQDNIPATGSSGCLVIAFFVPDQTKEPHLIWETAHEGNMTITLYEGVTFNASAGTDRAPKNSNRNSNTTSVLQGKATGSLVSDYVTVGENSADAIYTGGTVISLKRDYAARNIAGGQSRINEVVLKTNTNYAFCLENNETTTQDGQIILEWYEHSPKN